MQCWFRPFLFIYLSSVERWSVFESGAGLCARDRVQSCTSLQQGQDHHTYHLRQSKSPASPCTSTTCCINFFSFLERAHWMLIRHPFIFSGELPREKKMLKGYWDCKNLTLSAFLFYFFFYNGFECMQITRSSSVALIHVGVWVKWRACVNISLCRPKDPITHEMLFIVWPQSTWL